MWVSLVLFGMGLTGLFALFLCKHLERTRAVETPLTTLRRSGDPLITDGWRRWKEQFRAHTVHIFYRSSALCRDGAHKAGTRLNGFLHSLSVQFGEYLKRNGASGEKNDNASTYVKNMLEYKREARRSTDQSVTDKHE